VEVNRGAASDAELLERWAEGSLTAANELIERHFALVHRFFCHKVGSESEDLIQQTFLACIEARGRFQGRASFKTFLLAIARNQLFSHYARTQRRVLDASLSSVRDLGTSPTGAIARSEDERLLIEAFQRIPLDAQIVLELVYWEGLDVVEVAAVLEVPVNTAYSRLRRARLVLRDKLCELYPGRADLASFGRRSPPPF
jgi:RNA polymerase sigma factor (sigma-70 family)